MPVSEDRLRLLGFSRQKARAIKGLVIGIVDGQIDLEQLETMDDTQALNYLQAIHGIGRWSAEYALLRGLGRLNVFPGDDIGGQNNLQRLLSLPTRPDHQKIQEQTASWQPYAGLAYFYLLLDKLESGGALK
jgi:DNA-3-methyladenine glycosylase II